MKTTIELSDTLLERAKRLAARESTTLRELVESGLRHVLKERQRPKPFVLRDVRVDGNGLQEGFENADWEAMRSSIYEGRGA